LRAAYYQRVLALLLASAGERVRASWASSAALPSLVHAGAHIGLRAAYYQRALALLIKIRHRLLKQSRDEIFLQQDASLGLDVTLEVLLQQRLRDRESAAARNGGAAERPVAVAEAVHRNQPRVEVDVSEPTVVANLQTYGEF
jgi:hypothetical protein